MNILHWMRKENSGLARTTLEIAKYEELQGHKVCIMQPGQDQPIYGINRDMDVEAIHSQIQPSSYHNQKLAAGLEPTKEQRRPGSRSR